MDYPPVVDDQAILFSKLWNVFFDIGKGCPCSLKPDEETFWVHSRTSLGYPVEKKIVRILRNNKLLEESPDIKGALVLTEAGAELWQQLLKLEEGEVQQIFWQRLEIR